MTKPKDPEVIEEMQAAVSTREDESVSLGDGEDDSAGKIAEGTTENIAGETAGAADAGHDEMADDDSAAGEVQHDLHPAGAQGEYHPEEQNHRSLASTALMILVGAIAVAAGTLWAAPRVAPHLPAAIGQYLMPGQIETAAEIAALRQTVADQAGRSVEQIAALQARLDSVESALGGATARLDSLPDPDAAAANAAEALQLAREAGTQATALTRKADAAATELVGLRESLAAVNAALAGGDGTAAPAELSAAVAALNTRLDSLAGAVANRPELAALTERIDAFAARIDALESSAAAARSVQNQALGEVSTAIRQASLRSAVAALTSHVEGGQPYAAPLGEVIALTGTTPPPALAVAAGTGLATPAALGASFGPHAQAAIAADVQARSGNGASSQVLGWLRAQVTGRPVTEQAGEGVGATTSRIAARVREGALAEALAEAGTLPPHAQAALGVWLDQLRERVEAEAALSAWLTEIGANG